jgi:hypothetical protein
VPLEKDGSVTHGTEGEEVKLKTVGYSKTDTLTVDGWDGTCGHETGIALHHDKNGGWLIPHAEMERLIAGYCKAKRGKK